jgi:hypothetical protein
LVATCLAVLLAANLAFLAIRLADWKVPRDQLASSVMHAFLIGAVPPNSVTHPKLLGFDQASDCMALELAVLGNVTPVKNALLPRTLESDGGTGAMAKAVDPCAQLSLSLRNPTAMTARMGITGARPISTADLLAANGGPGGNYARFWHRGSTAAALALTAMSLEDYRSFLLLATLGLVALAAVVATKNGEDTLFALAPLLVVTFFFEGQEGYGQLVSYGPAQIACWIICCMTLAMRNNGLRTLCALATLAGAAEAFTDMMISEPLTAATFLVVAASVAAPRWREAGLRVSFGEAACILAAWTWGLAGSMVSKIAMTVVATRSLDAATSFVCQIVYRAGTFDPRMEQGLHEGTSRAGLFGHNLMSLWDQTWRLGWSSTQMDLSSYGFAALAAIGMVFATRRLLLAGRGRSALSAGMGYVVASVSILCWYLLFPEHTWNHTFFMVRPLAIWLAAGWGVGLCVPSGDLPERRSLGQTGIVSES